VLASEAGTSARSRLGGGSSDRGFDLGNPAGDVVALGRARVEILARIAEGDRVRSEPPKWLEGRSDRVGRGQSADKRINVVDPRWFDAALDQNCLYQLFCCLLAMIGSDFGQVMWAIEAIAGGHQIRPRPIEPTQR
jgi:hypothetical protein